MRATPFALILATSMVGLPGRGRRFTAGERGHGDVPDVHETLHPGIVSGWRSSRHAASHPLPRRRWSRRPYACQRRTCRTSLAGVVVGCAECHTLHAEAHAGSFEHNDYRVHVAVSPGRLRGLPLRRGGAVPKNIMSHAHGNLERQPGLSGPRAAHPQAPGIDDGGYRLSPPRTRTRRPQCLYCHGTEPASPARRSATPISAR